MGAKVLVIGGGGREHALAWKLHQSTHVDQLFVAPGNGGTAQIATNVSITPTDVDGLLHFAQENSIDLTVIGQEAASDAGVVDAFQAAGLRIFGSTKAAVQIEASKTFSKDLMREQHVPTAPFETFTDSIAAIEYVKKQPFPVVIKANGLAEGKGVVIAENEADALTAIDDMMVKKVFKDAGSSVVIEAFLKGQEVSIHALCDGNHAVLFPTSQDHKQVFDGGKGPNTGGMGVVAPLPWVTNAHLEFIQSHIVQPTLDGLKAKDAAFTGCLYPGLMIDGDNVNVIEFNGRFGDPEIETYVRLLDSDLYEIIMACTDGALDPSQVSWNGGAAISVAMASNGYPGSYEKGLPITGIDEAEKVDGVVVLQAGTTIKDGQLVTNGGRVLYVTALGTDISDARSKAYEAIKLIQFEGAHYRTDIGAAAEKASN